MIDCKKIEEIATRRLEGTELFVVSCTATPSNEVELLIDSDTSVAIDACVALSRAIEAQKFSETLRQCKVTEIEAKGEPFDEELMEAVARFAAGEEQKGRVIDVVQTGYKLGDKVLRFAKVVVGE